MGLKAFVAGLVLALGLGAAAQAATVTTSCPGSNPIDSVRDFAVTIDNTNGPATCIATGNGNINGNPMHDPIFALLAPGSILLDKSDDATSGTQTSALSSTIGSLTGGTSGNWFITLTAPLGFVWSDLVIAFKSGNGGGDPEWAAFKLPGGILSGTWSIDDPQCNKGCNGYQALSHVNLYGKLVAAPPPPPPPPVPLPATALLLLGALGGLGLMRRRKAA